MSRALGTMRLESLAPVPSACPCLDEIGEPVGGGTEKWGLHTAQLASGRASPTSSLEQAPVSPVYCVTCAQARTHVLTHRAPLLSSQAQGVLFPSHVALGLGVCGRGCRAWLTEGQVREVAVGR